MGQGGLGVGLHVRGTGHGGTETGLAAMTVEGRPHGRIYAVSVGGHCLA